jgi:hypothetical protein
VTSTKAGPDQGTLTGAGAGQPKLTESDRALTKFLDTAPDGLLRERRAVALRNLAKLAELRQAVEREVCAAVATAREKGGNWYDTGTTWEEIGKALGVTKQAAAARYGKNA